MEQVISSGLVLLALSLLGFAAWLLRLPAAAAGKAPEVPPGETAAMLAALKAPKRPRPLIAVVAINDATETNDFLMPTGILRRADVADVVTVATAAGSVKLFPALTAEPDTTISEFDERHPAGADFVIVPAMSRDDDPAIVKWIREQARKGATVIGVCAGARILGVAGLLDGKRATTHWYFRDGMLKKHPSIIYAADRRMVIDGRVATTTGITASIPMMLALVEAIAGRPRAEALAGDLGVRSWSARHASNAFVLTRPFALTVIGNLLAFWRRERIGIEIRPGMDEVSLALVADAWSRTYRSRAVTIAAAPGPVRSRNGIAILADRRRADWRDGKHMVDAERRPAAALDRALADIAARYGKATARIVAMQLEYDHDTR